MEDERFAAGDTIIVEGEKGSTFYIIMKGTVVIHQASKGNVGPPDAALHDPRCLNVAVFDIVIEDLVLDHAHSIW